MRLAAVYIKEHFLFNEPQTINLGGKYFYTITPREENENEYDITRKENPNFIENFWGENISLVSAIVGENGAGKTSVLMKMTTYNQSYPKIFFIWEEENIISFTRVSYNSQLNIALEITLYENNVPMKNKSKEILRDTLQIYFSPIFDYDIVKFVEKQYFHETLTRLDYYNKTQDVFMKTLFLTFGNLLTQLAEINHQNQQIL
jgi:hypothetical protein